MRETKGGLMKNIVPNNSEPSSYHGLYNMELDKFFSIVKALEKPHMEYTFKKTPSSLEVTGLAGIASQGGSFQQ